MFRIIIILLLISFGCASDTKKQKVAKKLPVRAVFYELTSGDGVFSKDVVFSEKGAQFERKDTAYIKVSLSNISSQKGINISLWFQITTNDPIRERMIFNFLDTLHASKYLSFWMAGDRVTGKIHRINLWAKE